MGSQGKLTAGDRFMLWGMFIFVLIMINVLQPAADPKQCELYTRGLLAAAGVIAIIAGALRRRAPWETRATGYANGAGALLLALAYGSPGTRLSLPAASWQLGALAAGCACYLLGLSFAVHRKLAVQ